MSAEIINAGFNANDALARNLHLAVQGSPSLANHPELAHLAATTEGDVARNAQYLTGARTLDMLAGVAQQTHENLQSQHADTMARLLASNKEPAGPHPVTFDETGHQSNDPTTADPRLAAAKHQAKHWPANSDHHGFSWGGLWHDVVQGSLGVADSWRHQAAHLYDNAFENKFANAANDLIKGFNPMDGWGSYEGKLASNLYGAAQEIDPINHIPGETQTSHDFGYNTAMAESVRNTKNGIQNLFVGLGKATADQVAHPMTPGFDLNNSYASVAGGVVHGMFNGLGQLGASVEQSYRQAGGGTKGYQAAFEQLLPTITAILATIFAPEVGAAAEGGDAAVPVASTAQKIIDANAGTGEEQAANAALAKTYQGFRTSAFKATQKELGLRELGGAVPSDLTVEEIRTALLKNYRQAIDEAGLTGAERASITKQMESADRGAFDDNQMFRSEAEKIYNQIRGNRSFSAGRAAWDLTKPVFGQVGKAVQAITDVATSKTTAAAGFTNALAPTDLQKEMLKNPPKNLMTIGQEISSFAGLDKKSPLSGVLDGIVQLIEPFPMFGRAAAAEKTIADSLVTSSADLDKAFARGGGYYNFLKKAVGADANKIVALTGNNLSYIAGDLAEHTGSIEEIHQFLKDTVDAATYTQTFRIPRAGLYTELKMVGKMSNSEFVQFFNRKLVSLPMVVDELNKTVINRVIRLGEQGDLENVRRLFTSLGLKPVQIKYIINELATNRDPVFWRMVLDRAQEDIFSAHVENEILKGMKIYSGFNAISRMSKAEAEAWVKEIENKAIPEQSALSYRVRGDLGQKVDSKMGMLQSHIAKLSDFYEGNTAFYDATMKAFRDKTRAISGGDNHAGDEGIFGVSHKNGEPLAPLERQEGERAERRGATFETDINEYRILNLHDFNRVYRGLVKLAFHTYQPLLRQTIKDVPQEIEIAKNLIEINQKLADERSVEAKELMNWATKQFKRRFPNENELYLGFNRRIPNSYLGWVEGWGGKGTTGFAGETRAQQVLKSLTVGITPLDQNAERSLWHMTKDEWLNRVTQLREYIDAINKKQWEHYLDWVKTRQTLERNNLDPNTAGEYIKPILDPQEEKFVDEYNKLYPADILKGIEEMSPNEIHQWVLAIAKKAGQTIPTRIYESSLLTGETEMAKLNVKIERVTLNNDLRAARSERETALQELDKQKTRLEELTNQQALLELSPEKIGRWGSEASNSRAMFWLKFGGGLNKIVNDLVFKPLALFSVGWAERVGLSEIGLNTARVGPRNMLAGYLGASIADRESKAAITAQSLGQPLKARELDAHVEEEFKAGLWTREEADAHKQALRDIAPQSMLKIEAKIIGNFVRGLIVGMDESLLMGIGKEEYIKSATELAYLHEPWLSDAVNSRHALPGSDANILSRNPNSIEIEASGKVKVKKITASKKFRTYELTQSGYHMGWMRGAARIAGSDWIGRPAAKAYLDLVDAGYTGTRLTEKAIEETEKILRNLPDSKKELFDRSLIPSSSTIRENKLYDSDPIKSWAKNVVANIEGTVRGKGSWVDNAYEDGAVHRKLLQDIVNRDVSLGTEGFFKEYAINRGQSIDGEGKKIAPTGKQFPPEHMPHSTFGPEFNTSGHQLFSRFITLGHEKLLRPVVETIARKPIFVVEYHEARQKLEPMVANGRITADQASVMAQTAAAKNMIRFIHNPADKMVFEQTMSLAAPFYFAQNQAWRRMGRLFSTNPGAFFQYLETMLAVQNWAAKTSQQNGISQFVLPVGALFGIPTVGSLSSLMTVDPLAAGSDSASTGPKTPIGTFFDLFAPRFGPVVTIPTRWLTDAVAYGATHWGNDPGGFLWKSGYATLQDSDFGRKFQFYTMGAIGENSPVWQSFIPSTIARNAVQLGLFASGMEKFGIDTQLIQAQITNLRSILYNKAHDHYQSLLSQGYNKDVASAYTNIWMTKICSSPQEQQQLISMSKNRAVMTYAWKMLTGFFSPVATSVGQYRTDLSDQIQRYNTKYGFPQGVDKFYQDHPDATIMTVYGTKSVYGEHISETQSVFDAMSANRNLIKKYPASWPALLNVPTGGKFYEPANTALIDAGIRQRLMPPEFLKSFLVQMGNDIYFNQVKKLTDQLRAHGHSSMAYQVEQSFKNSYGVNYNPEWLSSYNSKKSLTQRLQNLEELKIAIKDKEWLAQSPENVKRAAEINEVITTIVPLFKTAEEKAKRGIDGMTYATIKHVWDTNVIPGLLKTYPDLRGAITTVFANLT